MNLTAAEEDEGSLLSPVLSTKKSLSVFNAASTETNKTELDHDDSDLCSPIFDRNYAKKSKLRKYDFSCLFNATGTKSSDVNKDGENFLSVSAGKSTKNSSNNSASKDTLGSSKKRLETMSSKTSCFLSFKKTVSAADKVSKTSKVRLFSHDAFDDVQNFSKDSPVLENQKSLCFSSGKEKGLDQDRSEDVCSPEIKSKQRTFFNAVSPEIKTKKICLSSSRKRKSKHCEDVENWSRPEESLLSVTSSSNNFSNRQKLIVEEKSSELDQNTVNNLNSENLSSSVNFEIDPIRRYNYFNISPSKLPQAIGKIQSVGKTDISSRKQGDSESSSISSTTELIENSQSDSKNTEIKTVLQSNLPTSPILRIKFSTFGKVKKKSDCTKERIDSCQSETFFTPQNNSSKKCSLTSQFRENISDRAPDDTKSKCDPCITPLNFSTKKETEDTSRLEISSMVSSPLTSPTTFKKQNLVRCSLPINRFSPFTENSVNSSGVVSLSNGTSINSVRKRLGFHSSSTEKRKSRNNKPVRRLSLKKTSNLENQFSKFSEFCKLNTNLSTKSPSSVTIRKSKLKKFYANKEEESCLKGDLNSSENCYDFDRSPSPILQPSMCTDSKSNRPQGTPDVNTQPTDTVERYPNEGEINLKDPECCIENQTDDDPLSPCLTLPKNSIPSKNYSEFPKSKMKPNKKFKFSLDSDLSNLDSDKECDDMNKPPSPVLKVRKKIILKSDDKVIPCNIDEDQDPQIDPIDVTDADIDDSAVDYGTILSETVLDRIPEMGEAPVIEDDVLSTPVASTTSKNQCSMIIEVSESSGTVEQSQISDGNLPCDNARVKESVPSPPQSNFPQNKDAVYESGKKRKRRYKNGTLSARLNKLLKRTKSETRMWAHESQSDASNSAAIDLVVKVISYEMNKWLLKCCLVTESVEDDSRDVYFVILHPSAINNALITPGIILRVFPKWQTLELSSPKVTVIFNITRVKLIQGASSTDSSNSLCGAKQDIQVAEVYCSCPRDSVHLACVHNLLKRQILLGPLIPTENRNDAHLS